MLKKLITAINIKREKSTLLGMQINSGVIRFLQLRHRKNLFEVQAYNVTTFDPKAIALENKNIAVIANIIKQSVQQAVVTTPYVAIAIDDASVINKVIQMDATLSDYEIEQQIIYEAEKYIPFKLSEVNIDFQVLGPTHDSPGWRDVKLVIARTETITFYQQLLLQAGLILKIVDLESCVSQRVAELSALQLSNQGIDNVIAVVNIDEARIHITVLNNFNAIFTRSEILNLSEKNTPLFQNTLLQYIQGTLQFFFSAHVHREIHGLLLIGLAVDDTLLVFLSEQLAIPIVVADPFVAMSLAVHLDKEHFLKVAPSLVMSCGLAVSNSL